MKKLFLGLIFVLGIVSILNASSAVEKKDISPPLKVTTVDNTCYYRICTTTTGSDGVEFKVCSDWKEIDCDIAQEE